MARFEITGPDGSKYEITAPDGATEQQALDYFRSQQQASAPEPAPKPPKPDAGRTAAFAGGFNTMALGAPMSLVADAADLLTAGVGYTGSKLFGMEPPNLLNRENIWMTPQWLEKNAPSIFKPAGSDEHRFTRAAGMGAASAVMGPMNSKGEAVRRAAIGAVSAPVGQAVAEATGSPSAGVLASMTLPIGAGALQAAVQNRASLLPFLDPSARQAELALAPHTQEQITNAINLQRAANQAGSPITASQALGNAPRMVGLERRIYESQYAPPSMLQEAQNQPKVVAGLAKKASEIAGPKNLSLERANAIETAADTVMESPRKLAGAGVQPIYDMLKRERPQLPEDVRWGIAAKLENLNNQVGLLEQSSAGSAVGGVAGTVTQPSQIVNKQGAPFRRAEGGIYELDNYLKELRTRIERISSVNPDAKQLVEKAGLAPAHSEIRNALVNASPELAKAKADYQIVKETLDATVRRTGIPDMSRRFNADPTASKTAAGWNTLEKLITKQQSADDLRMAERMLTKQDRDAFLDVTKNLLGKTLDQSPDTATFVKNVRAIPNVETAIELAAKARGAENPKAVAKGFMRALDVIEAGTRERGGLGSPSTQVDVGSAGRFGATMAIGHELARKSALLGKVRNYLEKNEIETLISNMNSPSSLENLVNLANSQAGSPKFTRTLGMLLTPTNESKDLAVRSLLPLTYGVK